MIPFEITEEDTRRLRIEGPSGRIIRAVWGPLNQTIVAAGEDSIIRQFDVEVSSIFLHFCHKLYSSSFFFSEKDWKTFERK